MNPLSGATTLPRRLLPDQPEERHAPAAPPPTELEMEVATGGMSAAPAAIPPVTDARVTGPPDPSRDSLTPRRDRLPGAAMAPPLSGVSLPDAAMRNEEPVSPGDASQPRPRLMPGPSMPSLLPTLLGPQPQSSDTPGRREVAPAASQPAPAIRVSIGRIEVRAVTPPTPPAVPAQPAPPLLSLDDYLRAYNRDSR
jgi:hypothetical protein